MRIAGADGCRGGWVVVCADDDFLNPRIEMVPIFEQLPDALGGWPDILAVDIPIGLIDDWDRSPEPAARAILGTPRRASVFPAPPRRLLEMFISGRASGSEAYAALNQWSKLATGKGLQRQTFNILKKIGEVDTTLRMTGAPPGVFEVHPELAFMAMNGGQPTRLSKRRKSGGAERRSILSRHVPATLLGLVRPRGCAENDLLDAVAASWSAWRISDGRAEQVGAFETDPVLHRPIAIWY